MSRTRGNRRPVIFRPVRLPIWAAASSFAFFDSEYASVKSSTVSSSKG
jgi:hypothetical protein